MWLRPDPAALVTAQVHHHAASCLGDQPHRLAKLRSAVALDAAEHVAGQALAVHPDEHGVVAGDVTDHEREVGLTVEHALERVATELAPLGRQPRVGGLLDELLVTAPVADEVGDRHEDETVLVGEPAQVRAAGHVAAVEDELAEHARGSTTGEPGEVDGCLGVTDALQHAAGPGAQREDVPGTVERLGADRRVGERPQGCGAVRGRDAGRGPLGEVDGDGERRAVRLGVLVGADHRGEVEVVAPLAGQPDADDAGGVTDEERDRLGRGRVGGHDQVALVLAVLVVGDDDDLAAGDRRDRVLDRVERRGRLSGVRAAHRGAPVPSGRYADTSRSTYLAITSTSRLTRSPGRLVPSVVTSAVCGMIATVKPSSRGCTIVRLTPSTVTEPFSTR